MLFLERRDIPVLRKRASEGDSGTHQNGILIIAGGPLNTILLRFPLINPISSPYRTSLSSASQPTRTSRHKSGLLRLQSQHAEKQMSKQSPSAKDPIYRNPTK